MTAISRTTLGRTLAVSLSLALSQVSVPAAQAAAPSSSRHLVDSSQVVGRLLEQAKSREEKVRLFEAALATPEARQQAKALGVDADKLRAAVPHLSDKELQDLSDRAARVKDVAAGHHPDDGLVILGIILLLVGLAVLIAVASDGHYNDCYCY